MELIESLSDLDCARISRFSFDGIETFARVAKIHDPDTFTLVFKFNEDMIKISARLDGIDAPELHSSIEEERDACLRGIAYVKSIIEDKVIRVSMGKFDKYGRVLCKVYTLEPIEEGISCVNDILLAYQYVRPYSGDKKLEWTPDELEAAGSRAILEEVECPIQVTRVKRVVRKSKRITI